ncbi:type IX secretion system motor protein PorM/GldM [Sediminitomix flava]|uniref:Gliding motility-associated protein GldM n=1 Tax=Sediminitomix flava TaxID=379075 RepID=A0A315Z8L1_SEDFL|nr:gliding motility protein GldM [Sediminitomix flava]PWJ40779.1 gliding motility-associated protein GldM [Sediminitomix flava]
MAGGAKETPRQKMIGLMYLVLMAMLAINVSSTVLEKFMFMRDSLQASNDQAIYKNAETVSMIEAAAAKSTEKKIKEVYADAKSIQQKTDGLVQDYIDAVVVEKLKEIAGYDPVTQEITYLDKYDDQMVYTIGNEVNGKGEAYTMQTKLNEYASFVKGVIKKNLEADPEIKPEEVEAVLKQFDDKIAKDGGDIEAFNDNDHPKNIENRKKDFAHLQFDHTPNVACFALIEQLKADVYKYESQALAYLAKKADAKTDFDRVEAMVMPESRYVAAGTKYKAKMFIAASSSSKDPDMKFGKSNIKVEDGKGSVEFVARASDKDYDKNGQAKKSWSGSITYSTPFGPKTIDVNTEYYVVKPSIEIQSTTVNTLYRGCANTLNVKVPALGQAYNPTFKTTNAEAIKGQGSLVTIYPGAKAKKVDLSVYNGSDYIGKQSFTTKAVPKPTVVVKDSRGKAIDLMKGLAVNDMKMLIVEAKSDEEFKNTLPKEARYQVAEAEVIFVKGNRPIGRQKLKLNTKNGMAAASLKKWSMDAKKGNTRLVVEVKKVYRVNSKGQKLPVSVPSVYPVPIAN